MRDLIESLSALLRLHLGLEADPTFIHYAIVIGALSLPALGIYRWIRHQLGDFRALSSELHAVTRVISEDTKPEFIRLAREFSDLHTRLESNLSRRLDTISIALRSTHSVDSRPDDADVENEPPSSAPSRRTRLAMAESVRDVVLDRWLAGTYFLPHDGDRNTFHYYGMSETDEAIYLYLQTPYRQGVGIDERLPYTLQIWVNRYKKLNFEWDIEGNYALRGFKKGDWIDDVANWNLKPLSLEDEERKQA